MNIAEKTKQLEAKMKEHKVSMFAAGDGKDNNCSAPGDIPITIRRIVEDYPKAKTIAVSKNLMQLMRKNRENTQLRSFLYSKQIELQVKSPGNLTDVTQFIIVYDKNQKTIARSGFIDIRRTK
jgi:hypothetical protein